MTQPYYPVVGIEGTGIQPRLEIRDLQKKPIQFSLFIRALNKIHEMRNNDQQSPDYLNKPNSWWQIGTHIPTRSSPRSLPFHQGRFTDYPIYRGGEMS